MGNELSTNSSPSGEQEQGLRGGIMNEAPLVVPDNSHHLNSSTCAGKDAAQQQEASTALTALMTGEHQQSSTSTSALDESGEGSGGNDSQNNEENYNNLVGKGVNEREDGDGKGRENNEDNVADDDGEGDSSEMIDLQGGEQDLMRMILSYVLDSNNESTICALNEDETVMGNHELIGPANKGVSG